MRPSAARTPTATPGMGWPTHARHVARPGHGDGAARAGLGQAPAFVDRDAALLVPAEHRLVERRAGGEGPSAGRRPRTARVSIARAWILGTLMKHRRPHRAQGLARAARGSRPPPGTTVRVGTAAERPQPLGQGAEAVVPGQVGGQAVARPDLRPQQAEAACWLHRLSWLSTTPRGVPLLPLVNWIRQGVSGRPRARRPVAMSGPAPKARLSRRCGVELQAPPPARFAASAADSASTTAGGDRLQHRAQARRRVAGEDRHRHPGQPPGGRARRGDGAGRCAPGGEAAAAREMAGGGVRRGGPRRRRAPAS